MVRCALAWDERMLLMRALMSWDAAGWMVTMTEAAASTTAQSSAIRRTGVWVDAMVPTMGNALRSISDSG